MSLWYAAEYAFVPSTLEHSPYIKRWQAAQPSDTPDFSMDEDHMASYLVTWGVCHMADLTYAVIPGTPESEVIGFIVHMHDRVEPSWMVFSKFKGFWPDVAHTKLHLFKCPTKGAAHT